MRLLRPEQGVEIRGLRKRFGQTVALDGCSLQCPAGSVTVLLGENGSGKSTLVKVLAGIIPPDGGDVTVGGVKMRRFSPAAAQALGVQAVMQEILVVGNRSVFDNIALGPRDFWRNPMATVTVRSMAADVLHRLAGNDAPDLDALVATLTLPQKQLVAITRALVRQPRVLILDEATSSLDVAQRDAVMAEMQALARGGATVIFISHRMDEVLHAGDRIVVLRAGRVVDVVERGQASPVLLFRLMHGEGPAEPPACPVVGSRSGNTEPLLQVEGLVLRCGTSPIDLMVRPGEIIGVAGLEGHGQQAFLRTICGLEDPFSGRVIGPGGKVVRTLDGAVRAGIAYVPRDRKTQGIFPTLSVLDNFAMPILAQHSMLGFIRWRELQAAYVQERAALGIVDNSPQAPIATLSGGNQQKVLVARWLATAPEVLVLDDPTRGVDVATKASLHQRLRRFADSGHAVVLLSTEVEELVALCQRVLVFHRGQLVTILEPPNLNYEGVVAAMFGQANAG